MSNVLQAIGGLNAGGAEALVVDLYRNTYDEHKFIFICYIKSNETYLYEDEVVKLGGKVVRIHDNRVKNPLKFLADIIRVIRTEKITVVHSHVDLSSAYFLFAAWLMAIRTRIAHSHNSFFSMPRILHPILKLFIRIFSTDRVAVSHESGIAMFGSAAFKVIVNGIRVDQYTFSAKDREDIRQAIGIDANSTVWLTVGRLSYQKNQSKLLRDFSAQLTKDQSSHLVVLGEGELLDALKHEAAELKIEHAVHFLGRVSDAYRYYSAADLFVLTSRYEGLSIACIEAQANGLPCVLPSNTSKESIINSNVLLKDVLEDVDNIKRIGDISRVREYDISIVTERIARMYNRKIKVGLLIDEFFGGAGTAYGGYGFLAREYVARLIPNDDIEVQVVLGLNISRHRILQSLLGAVKASHDIVDGVHLYRAPWLSFMRKKWLKKQGYDVYLSIELTGTCDYILRTDADKRLILWVQDPRPASAWAIIDTMQIIKDVSFYNQRLYDFVSESNREGRVRFISQGETLNPLARELYTLPKDTPIEYVPNPIKIDFDYKFDVAKKRKSIIFLGRLEAQKRCWLFCEVAKLMPEYDFYVIGQLFRYKKENEATLAQYMDGSIKNLHFIGHLDGEKKQEMIKDARLLLSTSIWEGIPISWLEALSFGTLLVSAFEREDLVGQFGEYIGSIEGDGFKDVKRFVPAIKKLMENDELYSRKAEAAIAYVRERHSTEAFTDNLRKVLYEEVSRELK